MNDQRIMTRDLAVKLLQESFSASSNDDKQSTPTSRGETSAHEQQMSPSLETPHATPATSPDTAEHEGNEDMPDIAERSAAPEGGGISGQAPPASEAGEATLAQRVRAFLDEHDMAIAAFAGAAGLSAPAIHSILAGKKSRGGTVRAVEAVLSKKDGASSGEKVEFDPTCEQLIKTICDLAAERECLDELVRHIFVEWVTANKGNAKGFAAGLLRQYLAQTPESDRLDELLDLRDMAKNSS